MRILELLRLLSDVAKIPNLRDREACQAWLLDLLELLELFTTRTGTTIDDATVEFLAKAIADDEQFAALHTLIVGLLTDSDRVAASEDMPPILVAEAEKAGVNPLVIVSIVQAIIQLLKQFGWLKQG